jgi:predicted Ser/Thr protein kinase
VATESFGQYELRELLGRGGMGQVFRAYDTVTDRVVALKVLPAHLAEDAEFQQRFRREARIAASLTDPHMVPIHSYGEIDGRLYVDMRLIEGRDLGQYIADNGGRLRPERAVAVVEQVAAALDTAHEAGLIHRDVKPSNILVTNREFVYLIDFGLARTAADTVLTQSGHTMGTMAYMAPERFRGMTDHRADVYALACVLYECLTCQTPFPGSALEQIAVGHMVTPPPKPSEQRDTIPAALDEVIATGLAKKPAERYPTAVEMAAAARQALTGTTSQPAAMPSEPLSETRPRPSESKVPVKTAPWRRRPVLIAALVVVALLIAGGVVAAVRLMHDNPAAGGSSASGAPFTGTFKADFGPPTAMNGKPTGDAAPQAMTWGVRSACHLNSCLATATRRSPEGMMTLANLVFDNIGGRWVAVGVATDQCRGAPVEVWQTFTLEPRPDGTLAGEFTATSREGCSGKRTLTFARTGDVDLNTLPDPATLTARVVSPAEALHGRYHEVTAYADGHPKDEYDLAVTTYCLRTGDRCMSYFTSASISQPLVFSDGQWTWSVEGDDTCAGTDLDTHITQSAEYSLPDPVQNPIALLTGKGRWQQTGTCSMKTDIVQTFTRTGD